MGSRGCHDVNEVTNDNLLSSQWLPLKKNKQKKNLILVLKKMFTIGYKIPKRDYS